MKKVETYSPEITVLWPPVSAVLCSDPELVSMGEGRNAFRPVDRELLLVAKQLNQNSFDRCKLRLNLCFR